VLHTNITDDLLQLFQGIKEIKAYRQTESIANIFSSNKSKQSLISEKSIWLNSLVRYLLELAIILAASLIMIVLLITSDARHTVTIMVVFLAIGYRLIPNLQRIQNSIMLLRNTEGASELLFKLIAQFEKNKSNNPNKLPSQFHDIELKNIYFKHNSSNSRYILENINIKITRNTTTAIVGPSGAGKTTLVDIICGLYIPNSGEVNYLDQNKLIISNWQSGSKISYVSQNPAIFNGDIYTNVTFKNKISDAEMIHVNSILENLGLINLLYEPDGKTFKQIRSDGTNTSGGERQRISMARAIFFDSNLIILDEPSSALDEESKNKAHDFIKKIEGLKTVLIITHDENLISYCSRVVMINDKTVSFNGKIDEYLKFKKH